MSEIQIRPATAKDAAAMSDLINTIIEKGGTTAHTRLFDATRMTDHYIETARKISCTVAVDGAQIVGFQSLARSDSDDKFPADWGIIATFVADGQQGRGIGGRLFAMTMAAAQDAKISCIDATIRTYNTGGLAYYSHLGFEDYLETEHSISKKFIVLPAD